MSILANAIHAMDAEIQNKTREILKELGYTPELVNHRVYLSAQRKATEALMKKTKPVSV